MIETKHYSAKLVDSEIRYLMKHGYTIAEVADRIQVDRTTLHIWRHGKSKPGKYAWKRYNEAMHYYGLRLG